MMNIHLNWSRVANWDSVRVKLRGLQTTLYGNFADYQRENVETAERELTELGFTITRRQEHYPNHGDYYLGIGLPPSPA